MTIGALALLLLVNSLSVPQGSTFEVRVPHADDVSAVTATWQDKKIPLVREGDVWIAAIGVDLDLKAGAHTARIEIQRRAATGSRPAQTSTETLQVNVTAVPWPTRVLEVEPKYVNPPKEEEDRIIREDSELKALHRKVTSEKLWNGPFRSPVEGVAEGSSFGSRSVFNGQARSPHAGADLRAVTGTRILATNRGRVVLAKDLYFTGNTVIVDHGLGVYSLYAHLSRIDVAVGAMVDSGQLLGLSGATGRVTGPHLHWGIKAQDARVDPFSLITVDRRVITLELTQSR
jgi:murein DD-endopeptidase MepM/ murein hydrolase activator NlpD